MKAIIGFAGEAILGTLLLAAVLLIVGSIAEIMHAKEAGIPLLQWFDTGIVERVTKRPYGEGG